jgi:hypothetical protein
MIKKLFFCLFIVVISSGILSADNDDLKKEEKAPQTNSSEFLKITNFFSYPTRV